MVGERERELLQLVGEKERNEWERWGSCISSERGEGERERK